MVSSGYITGTFLTHCWGFYTKGNDSVNQISRALVDLTSEVTAHILCLIIDLSSFHPNVRKKCP